MQVVLPDPFGPTRPRTSPTFSVKLTPSSARKPPNCLATSSRRNRGSRDIDAPLAQQRRKTVREEEDEQNDQSPADQLEILRRGDAHAVIDPVQDRDTQNGTKNGAVAAEQREHDRKDREFTAEHRLRIEHRDVPSEGAAGETCDQRAQQPP